MLTFWEKIASYFILFAFLENIFFCRISFLLFPLFLFSGKIFLFSLCLIAPSAIKFVILILFSLNLYLILCHILSSHFSILILYISQFDYSFVKKSSSEFSFPWKLRLIVHMHWRFYRLIAFFPHLENVNKNMILSRLQSISPNFSEWFETSISSFPPYF